MSITLVIDDAVVAQFAQGFATATNYSAASGLTQQQWFKQQMIAWAKAVALSGMSQAYQTATLAPQVAAMSIT